MSIISCIKSHKPRTFRRLYMKRRLTTGEYETDWQLIPNRYVKRWGMVEFNTDDILPNFFRFEGLTVEVVNNDGYFSNVDAPSSFWYGYLTRFKTLLKIQAGYIDTGDVELPTETTLYIGLLGEDMRYQEDNRISFTTKHISSILEEVPSDRVSGLGTTQTASDIITKIKDYQDSLAVKILQKYISSGAWNIQATTLNYNIATSTSLQNVSCWELMQKLAGAENCVVYVGKDGSFFFKSKTDVTSTVAWHFSGLGDTNHTYGHNIEKKISIDEGLRKVYNRIKIKFNSADTTTSYYIKNETWNWGDSSSSFRFGIREYSYDNYWLTTASAETIANTIYSEYSEPKTEVELETKFIPQLNLLDRVSLTYQTKTFTGGDLWGIFRWDEGIWGGAIGYNINLSDVNYKIINIQHNLDDFKSKFLLREI